jgi:hypothetical protein
MTTANESVRLDPRWLQVEQVMQRYAASRTASLERFDDGSSAWVMTTIDKPAQQTALAELEQLRRDLSTRHPAGAVAITMKSFAAEVLEGPDFEPGRDCDRITPYEPYGSPATEVRRALQAGVERDQLAAMDFPTLADHRERLVEEISDAYASDSPYTARRTGIRLDTVNAFIDENGLTEQVKQWAVESRLMKVIGSQPRTSDTAATQATPQVAGPSAEAAQIARTALRPPGPLQSTKQPYVVDLDVAAPPPATAPRPSLGTQPWRGGHTR